MSDVTTAPPASFEVNNVNRLRRRFERGHYDKETVYAILDAALICHIAYVIDGRPFCTIIFTGTAPLPAARSGSRTA